jgi:hypothetical protein
MRGGNKSKERETASAVRKVTRRGGEEARATLALRGVDWCGPVKRLRRGFCDEAVWDS